MEQLRWFSGFCTIRLSLCCLFYGPNICSLLSQLFCYSGYMFIFQCTLMNDEILTSTSNPIPTDLCASLLHHMCIIAKRSLNKEREIKKVLKVLGMEFCLFTSGFVWMLGGHEQRENLMFRGESHFLN